MEKKRLAPVHPGEVLREDFLLPRSSRRMRSRGRAGFRAPGSSASREKERRSPPTRRCVWRVFFGTTPGFRMNIQAQFDLESAADDLAADIAQIEPLKHNAA